MTKLKGRGLPIRHKFGAVATITDGIRFDSKKEARFYGELCLRKKEGEVIGFLRQVPMHLSGGIRYTMDFLVFYANGECEGIEVNGYETKEWKLKQKLIKAEYPWFKLRVVK